MLQDTDGNGVLDCDEKVEQSISQSIEDEEKPEVTDVIVSFNGTGNMVTAVTVVYNKIADLQRRDMITIPCRNGQMN